MGGFSFVPLSSTAQEIAGGREELLGLLRGLPPAESADYELSLTDIVERGSVVARGSAPKEKAAAAAAAAAATSHEGERIKSKTRAPAKEKEKKTMMMVSSKSSFRSASDGVLLNVYLPASLTRSLTAPRMTGGGAAAAAAVHRPTTDCSIKRDAKPATVGCWSALWLRGKPRREVAAKIR